MASFGRGVPAAATAGLEAADPIAGRDGGSTTAGKIEVRLAASRCSWGTKRSTVGQGSIPSPAPVSVTLGKSLHLSELQRTQPAQWYLPYWVGLVHRRCSVKVCFHWDSLLSRQAAL